MSNNGRLPSIPLAQPESLEEDGNEIPPPPSYHEAMAMDLVTSIQEPPASASGVEDDSVLGELLNRVKEQREDLKAELGVISEDSDDSQVIALALPELARGESHVPADSTVSSSDESSDVAEDPTQENRKNQGQEEKKAELAVAPRSPSLEKKKEKEEKEPDKKEEDGAMGRSVDGEKENEDDEYSSDETEHADDPMIPAIVLDGIQVDLPDEDQRELENLKKLQRDISKQREEEAKPGYNEELEMMSIKSEESGPGLHVLDPSVRRLSLDTEDDRYSPRHSTFEQFEIDNVDTEAATVPRRQARSRRDSDYDCGPTLVPFLREIVNFGVKQYRYLKTNWPHWSLRKQCILVFSVLFVVGLVLLVSLLPASFVYVDYDEMGFVHNRATGKTDYSHVYDYGCYLMAPQHTLVLFPSTAQFLDLKLWVFDRGGLTVGLDIYLQYFLRPHELAEMYQKYHYDYHNIVTLTAQSAVKNVAVKFSLEEFRLNRSMVEASLFSTLRVSLSGDCCKNYQNSRFQLSNYYHQPCSRSDYYCSRGKHVDLGFFQFGALHVPDAVLDRYMRQVVLEMEAETEVFIQEKAVQEKLTALSVQKIMNEAKEIREAAEAKRTIIIARAKAARLRENELAYVTSLKKVYSFLNITKEDVKMSLLYMNTLKKKDDLVAFSYNYDGEAVFSP